MQSPALPRRRLEKVEVQGLDPFVRAPAITDASVYWMPVRQFPMLPRDREWLAEFHRRLAILLQKEHGLREELFLQFKVLYPDLIDRFTATSSDFMPVTGMSLRPGTSPVSPPDLDSIREQVEGAQKGSTGVDTTRWMPDYLHWFVRKQPEKQREAFLGHGGLITLYLAPDGGTAAPVVEMPGFVKKMSIYDPNMQEAIQAGYSLRDTFLPRSKEVFGAAFKQDPAFKGMAFILPLLNSESLLQATPEERSRWFEVFSAYLIESRPDSGIVLALKEPDFDAKLIDLLADMRREGFTDAG